MTDEIILRFRVADDGSPVLEKVNQKIGETGQKSKALVPGLESARKSLTGFVGDNAALIGVLVTVGATLSATYKEYARYAEGVRDFSLVSGQSAEAASRFIQVLDDYQLTVEDATTASRFLKEKGMVPNIETLIKLSNEFKKIKDPAERLAFIQENLGRGGAKWVNILNQEESALRDVASQVNKNLILTDEQIRKSELARLAVDNWNDSWQGFKIGLGSAVGELIVANEAAKRANEIYVENGGVLGPNVQITKEWKDALAQAKKEQEAANIATKAGTDAAIASTEALEAQAAAIKVVSDLNQVMLGLIGDIASAEMDYHDQYQAIASDISLTDLERKQQLDELAAKYEETNIRILDGLVERKLMEDGILDNKEFDWLIKKRVEWGIYSEEAAEKARAVWAEADHITASIANIPANKTISITTIYNDQYLGGRGILTGGSLSGDKQGHADGGSFMIPSSYGNEGFRLGNGDTASGGEKLTITPRGKEIIDYDKLASVLVGAIRRAGG